MRISISAPIVTLYCSRGSVLWSSNWESDDDVERFRGVFVWDVITPETKSQARSAFAQAVFFGEESTYWTEFDGHAFFVKVYPVPKLESVACCTISQAAKPGHARITEREQVVFDLLGKSLTIEEIATKLFVSQSRSKVTLQTSRLNSSSQR